MYAFIKDKALETFEKKNNSKSSFESLKLSMLLWFQTLEKKYEIKNNVIYENTTILIFCIYNFIKKKISIIYHILYFIVSSMHFKANLLQYF